MSYDTQLARFSKLIGREVQTLKRIGRSPIGMSRFDYIAEILPHIDNFMITDKADGTRGIIELCDAPMVARCVVGSEYFEITEVQGDPMIIDCEVLLDKKIVLIYDLLEYKGESYVNKTFADRHAAFEKLSGSIRHAEWTFKPKQFWALSVATYAKNIMVLHAAMKKYAYNTDGIIFTQINEPYVATHHYKWKPPEHLTIDFLVIDGNHGPELWSGISRRVFKQLGLQLPPDYARKAATWIKISGSGQIMNDFFPVPFTPSIAPLVYRAPIHFDKMGSGERRRCKKCGKVGAATAKVQTSATVAKVSPADIIGKIIEVSWGAGAWHFHRIRTDRNVELASGQYFGNNFEIAELTYQTILTPLTIADLVRPLQELTQNFYFEKSDDKYRAARYFNSFVKSQLISRSHMAAYVIDMASGKGQDLGRYFASKIKNLLMLEIDESALYELIRRKFDIAKKVRIDRIDAPVAIRAPPESTNILVAQMDLNRPQKDNIATIEKMTDRFRAGAINLIVCNMALHYLVPDAKHLANIAAFIAYWLKAGGEFIFTALNWEKVSALLKAGPWEAGPYRIERAKKANHIAVLLPCSRDLREEPIIEISALDKEFNRHKIIRVETKSFDEFLPQYKNARDLSPEDREFVSLYHYCIYKKIE